MDLTYCHYQGMGHLATARYRRAVGQWQPYQVGVRCEGMARRRVIRSDLHRESVLNMQDVPMEGVETTGRPTRRCVFVPRGKCRRPPGSASSIRSVVIKTTITTTTAAATGARNSAPSRPVAAAFRVVPEASDRGRSTTWQRTNPAYGCLCPPLQTTNKGSFSGQQRTVIRLHFAHELLRTAKTRTLMADFTEEIVHESLIIHI